MTHHSITDRMRSEWDARARDDAYYYVHSGRHDQTEADFAASGVDSVELCVLADLSTLTQERDPRQLRLLELGCGIGRMTKPLADVFGEVVGVDVSAEMISLARLRLAGVPNARVEVNNGTDLGSFEDDSFDVCFSFIVLQHIPERSVIERYIVEMARVLRRGGVAKFQVQGFQGADYKAQRKDTWLGETFSEAEMTELIGGAGLDLLKMEGPGTQYFWITAAKANAR